MNHLDSPVGWLRQFAHATPDRTALAAPGVRLSYRDLEERVEIVAAMLASCGVRQGDRVFSSLPLCLAAAVVALSAQRLGAVSVEVSRDLSWTMQVRAFARAEAATLFVTEQDAAAWQSHLSREAQLVRRRKVLGVVCDATTGVPLLMGSALARAPVFADVDLVLGTDGSFIGPLREVALLPDVIVDERAPALVLFTSGSTGEPVGVVLSSRNLAANARSIARSLELGPRDHAMCVLPLSYAYGRSILHSHLAVGGSVMLEPRFAFPRTVMKTLREEECTSFSGVPTTWELLRRHIDVGAYRSSALRFVTQAGGRLAPDTARWVRTAFAPVPLVVMYGATEACARLSVLSPARARDKEGSIGRAIPGVTLRIVDDDGHDVPGGVVGHLVARGDNIAAGYLNDETRSREVFRDGELWSGDLARVDEEGFIFLVGRAREMMKIGGHRTSPSEIEDELLRHADVIEAAVFGVADTVLGEAPVALLVTRTDIDVAALRSHLRGRLAPVKVPRAFVRVEALPKSPNGKLRRGELRALFDAHQPQPNTGG